MLKIVLTKKLKGNYMKRTKHPTLAPLFYLMLALILSLKIYSATDDEATNAFKQIVKYFG